MRATPLVRRRDERDARLRGRGLGRPLPAGTEQSELRRPPSTTPWGLTPGWFVPAAWSTSFGLAFAATDRHPEVDVLTVNDRLTVPAAAFAAPVGSAGRR